MIKPIDPRYRSEIVRRATRYMFGEDDSEDPDVEDVLRMLQACLEEMGRTTPELEPESPARMER